MKKTFKNILAVAGVLGLSFALNAVKPQHISARSEERRVGKECRL